jgi:putative membrane protein
MTLELRGIRPLLQVFDMPRSLAFYRDALGFEIVDSAPGGASGDAVDWARLRRGGAGLDAGPARGLLSDGTRQSRDETTMPQTTRSAAADSAVRDELARLRTVLANERTLLAFIRTALAFGAGGVAVVQLYTTPLGTRTGWGLVGLGAVTLVVGCLRFRTMHRRLAGGAAVDPDD